MFLGLRVVRGPDWRSKKEDGGIGGVGTVTGRVEGHGPNASDMVIVCWDCGLIYHYVAGPQRYELRVFNNASTGIKHDNIVCSHCEAKSISGIRWECNVCRNINLCQKCYMGGKHNPKHVFLRHDSPTLPSVPVPTRHGSAWTPARGMFRGAKVVRGKDWNRDYEDGLAGKPGIVQAVVGWDTETAQNGVKVKWTFGVKEVGIYRMGYKGKVDLQCVSMGAGPKFYQEHLPVLGKDIAIPNRTEDENPPERPYPSLDLDSLAITLDDEHEYVNSIPFLVGDFVEIARDEDTHGDRNIGKKFLGRVGRVREVTPSGDLVVIVEGEACQCPASVCRMVAPSSLGVNTLRIQNRSIRDPMQERLYNIIEDDMTMLSGPAQFDAGTLVREASLGNLPGVEEIVKRHPGRVDSPSFGKTALQAAAYRGAPQLVTFLLKAGANPNIQDEAGDTALHYSALRNQVEVAQILLDRPGTKVDLSNRDGLTPLQEAVSRSFVESVETLLKYHPNVNHQNNDGNTALHIAVDQENKAITQILLRHHTTDCAIQNNDGFNALHLAARNGNNFATRKLLDHSRELVDVKKPDGLSALHLAALNGKAHVITTLLDKGKANIDIRNSANQTPLQLGAFYEDVVNLLVARGAAVDAAPRSVRKKVPFSRSASLPSAPDWPEAAAPPLPLRRAATVSGQEAETECRICSDVPAKVVFKPCGHKVTCETCCRRVKKCLICQTPVIEKTVEVTLE